jgi:hypothetical protein
MNIKEDVRKEKRHKLFHGLKCDNALGKILDYLDTLAYSDKVDYKYIVTLVRLAASEQSVFIDGPYDWEIEPDRNPVSSVSRATRKRDKSLLMS